MVRPLTAADTAAALRLLRARPIHNVLLESLVRAGALGRAPGFLGYEDDGGLTALLFLAAAGGTALEIRTPGACAPLAEAASRAASRPRHIVGSEDVTTPFWNAYRRFAPAVRWERREPVYVLTQLAPELAEARDAVHPASLADLDTVVALSACQYREDIQDDAHARDPEGFRERHRLDVAAGRWWVLRERGRIVFQAHVGPENDQVVQVGGVFTLPERRGLGIATRGVAALCRVLLRRRPAVSLFCDEANLGARRVYERVGFEARFCFRSWLLDEPVRAG